MEESFSTRFCFFALTFNNVVEENSILTKDLEINDSKGLNQR